MTSDRFHFRFVGLCALSLVSLAITPRAEAAFIQLSTHATGNNDPEKLDALLDFNVTGNNLTLTVTNQTAEPNASAIREIFFNTTAALTSLTPVSLPDGFELDANAHAGGFGFFDWGIIGSNPNGGVIEAGETVIFTFTFTGIGVTDLTFLTELSDSNNRPMLVAAKFVGGPSAGGYGGVNQIPTPGSTAMILLAIAIGGPLRSRRRLAAA